jgi:hypothetical protein
MGRHKGYHPPRAERPDHAALFIEAGRTITRNAGLLDAYRRGTGLLIRAVRTTAAQDSLAAAIKESATKCPYNGGVPGAAQHAGKMAMCAYLGQWWTSELVCAEPASLGDGDEYVSRDEVRERVERGVSAFAPPAWSVTDVVLANRKVRA